MPLVDLSAWETPPVSKTPWTVCLPPGRLLSPPKTACRVTRPTFPRIWREFLRPTVSGRASRTELAASAQSPRRHGARSALARWCARRPPSHKFRRDPTAGAWWRGQLLRHEPDGGLSRLPRQLRRQPRSVVKTTARPCLPAAGNPYAPRPPQRHRRPPLPPARRTALRPQPWL